MKPKSPERDVGITQATKDVLQMVTSHGTTLQDLTVETHGPINVWSVYGKPKTPRIEVTVSNLSDYRKVHLFVDHDRVVLMYGGDHPKLNEIDLPTRAQLEQGEDVVPMFCAIIEGTSMNVIARPAVLAKAQDALRQCPHTVRSLIIPEDDAVQVAAVTELMTQMTDVLQTGTVSFQGQEFNNPSAAPGLVFREISGETTNEI